MIPPESSCPDADPEPSCSVECETEAWREHLPDLEHHGKMSADFINTHLLERTPPFAFTLILCDDTTLRNLNAQWRGKNRATNVLSFPVIPLPDGFAHLQENAGDVYIAFETVAREASELGLSLLEHTTHLIIHGILHLLGYDHLNDRERKIMEKLEIQMLEHFHYANPYHNSPSVAP